MTSYSSKEIIRILETEGFFFIRQKGSHARFGHKDGRKTTIPMNKKDFPIGTIKSISQQTQLNILALLASKL